MYYYAITVAKLDAQRNRYLKHLSVYKDTVDAEREGSEMLNHFRTLFPAPEYTCTLWSRYKEECPPEDL